MRFDIMTLFPDLVERVLAFSRPRLERPKLLALHASSRATSNTLALWGLVRTRLEERCDITEICLRNGTLEDCAGCPYTTCLHFGEQGGCFYGGVMVQEVYPAIRDAAFAEARKNGGLIEITDHAEDLKGADVIYGDVWASMGEEAQIPERVGLLSPFRVTMDTLKATENPDVLYLHCLPSFHDFETKMAKEWQAKGVDIREVTDEVFRSRHSVVFDEAENRMHSIKAVMVATIGA